MSNYVLVVAKRQNNNYNNDIQIYPCHERPHFSLKSSQWYPKQDYVFSKHLKPQKHSSKIYNWRSV